jgi:hypothetical protein
MTCPNCGFAPPPGAFSNVCPACGLLFARRSAAPRRPAPDWPENPLAALLARLYADLAAWARDRRAAVAADVPLVAGLRAGLLVMLAWTGWRYAALLQPTGVWGHPALHQVHLLLHEAGHMLLIPFGRFVTVAGGSLTQLALPVACLIAFLWRQRPEAFGAAVCLWWLGTSFVDLSPYIGDAGAMKLMAQGGFLAETLPAAHDWRYLLGALDLLPYAEPIARCAHLVGSALIVAGLGWGAWVAVGPFRVPKP